MLRTAVGVGLGPVMAAAHSATDKAGALAGVGVGVGEEVSS